jgi:SAM-dependent methyltransferase
VPTLTENLYLLMSSRRIEFISCRRALLDRCMVAVQPQLLGKVLDIGGRTIRRRGAFVPPIESVERWVTINPDAAAGADVIGGLPQLPFSDGAFDVVVCTEVLEYVDDVEMAMANIARVLGPEGTAYISVPFLHRLHGDSAADRRRFTGGYLAALCAPYFAEVRIKAMGGPAAVVFDLLWARAMRWRYLRPIFRLIGRLIAARDDGSAEDCTGFFIIARKHPLSLRRSNAETKGSKKQ